MSRERPYDIAIDLPIAPRSQCESGVDLRSHPRVTLHAEVTLVSASHFFAARAADVSRGGIFVATYAALPVGTVVEAELMLPDGPLAVVGTVRWAREGAGQTPGLGIEFELLFDEERARIEKFCAARKPFHYDIDEPDSFTV